MKTDLLAAVAVWGTLAEIVTWLMAAAALIVYGFAAWVVIAAGRLTFDHVAASFVRAHQTIADSQYDQPTPELDAGYARLDTAIDQHRKEKL